MFRSNPLNLKLLAFKFNPLLNWSLKSIPRSEYHIYRIWKKENPDVTEKELSIALFNRRFSTTLIEIESSLQKKARIKSYFEKKPELENLIDICVAEAMIEFRIPAENKKTYNYFKKIISIELFKLGYRYKL